MGESTLFARNDESWSKKRKVLSASFYKDKLIKYFDMIKDDHLRTIEYIKENFVKTGEPMDLIAEINTAHIRIQLTCAFGVDCSQELLDWTENGVTTKRKLEFMLIESFHRLFLRVLSP